VAGPVRACFRLVEPVDDEEWQVRDDPSSQPIAVGLSRLLFVVFLFLAWGNATFLLAIITLFAWMRQFRYA